MQINKSVFDRWKEYIERRNRVWQRKSCLSLDEWRSMDPMEKLSDVYEFDGVMMRFKFMNIWRELDAFSQHELKYIQNPEISIADKVLAICLGRLILNWPTTLHVLHHRTLLEVMPIGDAIRDPFKGKDHSAVKQIIGRFWTDLSSMPSGQLEALIQDSPLNTYRFLKHAFPCLGSFRPYEIVTSFTYLEECSWTENSFPFVGHGAKPALARMYNLDTECLGLIPDELWEYLLRDFMQKSYLHLGSELAQDWAWIPKAKQSGSESQAHKWTLRTAEDSLCEFRKWIQLWERNPAQRQRIYSPK